MILHLWHQNISCLATINSAKTVFWYQNLNPAKRCCCGVFRLGSSKSVPSLYPAWNSTAFFGVFFFAFYVLKFDSLYYFRVFSRLFLNSAKYGGQCRQERQEHLVHTAVFKASLVSLFTRQKEISTILFPLLLPLEKNTPCSSSR